MNIFVVGLGCAKNLVDTEALMSHFTASGHRIVSAEKDAGCVVIMTCAFIESARNEAREAIAEYAAKKKRYGFKLIVGGCYAKRYGARAAEEFPSVDGWFGIGDYAQVPRLLEAQTPFMHIREIERYDGADTGRIAAVRHWAYLKIADGCNHRCSYCVIPSIRGFYRSREAEDIEREAAALAESGVKELLLIAQDTGQYGVDLYGEKRLVRLLSRLEKIDGLLWLRLLYINPYSIDEELIDWMASSEKLVPYLDIPFQHASRSVLRRMARPGGKDALLALVEKLRTRIPDLAIRSTFIAGFPGETQEEFAELEDFLLQARLNRVGFFAYSAEEGTGACGLPGQLPERVKRERLDRLARLQRRLSLEENRLLRGKRIPVVIEGRRDENPAIRGIAGELDAGRGFYSRVKLYGRSFRDAPEVDGLVLILDAGGGLKAGDFVTVEITHVSAFDMAGKII